MPADAADAGAAVVTAAVDVAAAPRPRTARGRTPLPHSSSPASRTREKIILRNICFFFRDKSFIQMRKREVRRVRVLSLYSLYS